MYVQSSSSFTRPNDTTAYGSGDLVANSTTAGSVSPLTFTFPGNAAISRVKLKKSGATPTNANFTLHLYQNSPTVTNGDNGSFASTESGWLASIALDATTSLGSDANSTSNSFSVPVVASGTVYGLLRAAAAYTPAAQEVFTVTLYGNT